MRKLLIFSILAVLLIPLVLAQGTQHRIEFDDFEPVFFQLAPEDILVFDFPVRLYQEPQLIDGQEHIPFTIEEQRQAIKIERLGTSQGRPVVELAVFIKGAPYPYYPRLAEGDSLQLDFEFDELQDLVVQVISIDEEEGVTMLLIPQDVEGQTPNPHVFEGGPNNITGNQTDVVTPPFWERVLPQDTKVGYLVLAILIILLIVVINHRSIRKAFVKSRNKRRSKK